MSAVALLASGLVVASAPAAIAAYPDSVNPFAMAGGFTVYTREDALLQNQETEGSIAVGGTATVQGSSGNYSIIHVAAGTADYTLPTVDGDPTRFLVGEYSAESTGILQITSAGTSDPTLQGDLKLVDRSGPFQPFARADFIRLNTNPSNVDQTPLIDATHQQYPDGATPPSGGTGGGSIYTANTGATAVAEYVEANSDATWDQAQQCLADLPTTGYPVGVAEDAGDRVVLAPLSADQVNVVDYADVAAASLVQFSPGPTPGIDNPLVIRVPAGTTEVVGARFDPQGQYSPYILWDLSALTGDVMVTAPNGGTTRMDGSIYAPNADVTVTAAPLDGQIVGQNVTIRGGEVHSFLFAGTLACGGAPEVGTFAVNKALSGIASDDLPPGTVFTVDYTATLPDGSVETGSLDLPTDGSTVQAGIDFPVGTVVTFSEIAPPMVDGWEWSAPVITPSSITIGAGTTASVQVENTAAQQLGNVTVRKLVVDSDGNTVAGATGVSVAWTASDGQSGSVDVPADGTVVSVPAQFPLGTEVTFSEDLSSAVPPDGTVWVDAGWDPSDTVTVDDAATPTAVTLTNLVAPALTRRLVGARKISSSENESGYEYSIRYTTDAEQSVWATRALRIGLPTLLPGIAEGVTEILVIEEPPTLDGVPVDTAAWENPIISTAAGSQQVPFGTPARVTVPETGLIRIGIENALRDGTFSLSKAFASGIDTSGIRSSVGFLVDWTATTPTGEETTGTVRMPLNGDPATPVDADGAPVQFPFGTVITFTERTPPTVPGLIWGPPTASPSSLTIGEDGNATVTATVTNSASWRQGTFQVRKELVGIDPSLLPAGTTFTIAYYARLPLGTVETGSFQVPADGTPAGPGRTFPVGTYIQATEVAPDPSTLPPGYEWAGTTWGPTSHGVIREYADPTFVPTVTVTNSVQQFTRYAVTKTVAGNAASAVPDGTAFAGHAWVDTVQEPDITIREGETFMSRWLPVGTVVEAQEADFPDLSGVDWGDPVWMLADGTVLEPEPNGRVVLPAAAMGTQNTVELVLENQATTPLPATGSTMSSAIPIGGLAAILVGLALVVLRRPRLEN